MLNWILITSSAASWAGLPASSCTDAQQGILLNIVVGIVGAILGGLLLAPMLVAARLPPAISRFNLRSRCLARSSFWQSST